MMNDNVVEITSESIMNKLFCTFSPKDKLDDTLREINREYTILYKKIFVLESKESEEFLCTYNIEIEGGQTKILPNTILLHRKKETNTLYITISTHIFGQFGKFSSTPSATLHDLSGLIHMFFNHMQQCQSRPTGKFK